MPNAVYVAAGHSHVAGRDRGSQGNGLIEGNLNQQIVSAIVRRLREHGIKTYTDLDIGNPATKNAPNQVNDSRKHPDVKLYYEQHFNAFGSSTARGTETYKTGSGRSLRFARAAHAAALSRLRTWDPTIPDRKVKEAIGTRAEYIVTNAQGAAILDEALFLTSPKDAAIAKRSDFVGRYAETIVQAIIAFGRAEGLWSVTYSDTVHIGPSDVQWAFAAAYGKPYTASPIFYLKVRGKLKAALVAFVDKYHYDPRTSPGFFLTFLKRNYDIP